MIKQGVRIKLLMIVVFAVIAICGMGAFGVYNTKRTYESINQVRSAAEDFQQSALEINGPLNELRRTVLILVMAPDQKRQNELFEKQRTDTVSLDETLRAWKKENASGKQREAFERLKSSWEKYKKIKDTIAQNVLDSRREEAFINAIEGGQVAFDNLAEDVRNWQDRMIDDAKAVDNEAQVRYERMLWISTLAIILLSILVAAAGGVAIRTIMRPIETLKTVATRIADQSSESTLVSALDEKISIRAKDELGQLAEAFNKMIDNLRTSIHRVQSEQHRTQAILNSTADGILTIGENGTIRSCNKAAELLFKLHSDEAVGQNVSRFVPALYDKKQTYGDQPIGFGERRIMANNVESYGLGKGGRRLPLELRVIELEYGGERLYIATLQDITERKRVEKEKEKIAVAIADAVHRLSAASQQISRAAQQQTQGASDQSAAVRETSAFVTDVALASRDTAKRADDVATIASQANEVGLEGRNEVARSIEAMAYVGQQVEAAAGNIARLVEKAQTIGEITRTVNDIAEQTNVLALNAAVEASRAGEHGKGFAVVAAEVKSLALQSKEATKRVRSLLLEIKSATDQSVKSTEAGRTSAADASRIVTEAGDKIRKLSETLEKSAKSAVQIAATARQQATAVEQVEEGIQDISRVTQQNTQAVEQIEVASQSLTTLSIELSSLTTVHQNVTVTA